MGQVLRNHFVSTIFLLGMISALNPVWAGNTSSVPKEDDIERTCHITTLPKEILSHIFEQVENWSSPATPYNICKDFRKKFIASDKHREIKRKLKKCKLILELEKRRPSFTLKKLNEIMEFEAYRFFKVKEFFNLFTYEENQQIFQLKESERNKKDSLNFLKRPSCYSYLFIEAHKTIIKEFPDHLIYFPDLKDVNELKAFYEIPEIIKNYVNLVWETPSIQPLLCKYYLSLNPIDHCKSVAFAAYLAQDPGFSKILSATIEPYKFEIEKFLNVLSAIRDKSLLSQWNGWSMKSLHKYLMGLKILALANDQTAIDMMLTYNQQLIKFYDKQLIKTDDKQYLRSFAKGEKFLLDKPYNLLSYREALEYDFLPFTPSGGYLTSYHATAFPTTNSTICFPTEYKLINPFIFTIPYWGSYTVAVNPEVPQEMCIALLKNRLENNKEYRGLVLELCEDSRHK